MPEAQDALALAEELEKLLAEATPGPWHMYSAKLRPQFKAVVTEVQDKDGRAIILWGGFDDSNRPRREHNANAELAAKARNLVPFVVAALRALALIESGGILKQWGPELPERKAVAAALALARSLEEGT